jgi:hypothetical protein
VNPLLFSALAGMQAAHANLGSHALLVLHKLGFDLRQQLDATLEAPLPPELARLADEVDRYAEWRDVAEPPPQGPVAATPVPSEFVVLDTPLL